MDRGSDIAGSASRLPKSLRELRVAAICDRFTADNLGPECELIPLAPDSWHARLIESRPHVLFVESAWEGLAGEWRGKLQSDSELVAAIVGKCRELRIPTAFWNKEDPLHFEAFLGVARLCDVVFTTDAAIIPRYKRELSHSRVHVLPFALQPRLHHPIRQQGEARVEGSFFAGAWYGRHPNRCRDFVNLADALSLVGPFEIFDRNSDSSEPEKRFPARYAPSLREAIAYAETPSLYRRYRIGLTMNTVKQSPTMFARRALELIGTGTSVYSNYSSALNSMLGEFVVSTDDGDRILREAYAELQDPQHESYRARRQAALRKVLLEHCWESRLRMLLHLTHGRRDLAPVREAVVVTRVHDQAGLQRLSAMLDSQKGVRVVAWVDAPVDVELPATLHRLSRAAMELRLQDVVGNMRVAPWHPADFYGESYLLDLLLSLSFGQGGIVGKAAYGAAAGGRVELVNPELENRRVEKLSLRRALFPVSAWTGTIGDLLDGLDELEICGDDLVSVDGMSYVKDGAHDALSSCEPSGAPVVGWVMSELREFTEQMPASDGIPGHSGKLLTGADLVALFSGVPQSPMVSMSVKASMLELVSKLPPGQEVVVRSRSVAKATVETDGRLEACLAAAPSSAYEVCLEALDRSGRLVMETPLPGGVNVTSVSPGSAVQYRISARVRGSVVSYVDGLHFSHATPTPIVMPGRGRLLVVVNQYPSRESLYRNAFVHRRVKAYLRLGMGVDVVWLTRALTPTSYEYDGVQVRICDPDTLCATLRISGHQAIAVHFLDPDMWTGIEEAASGTRTVVWLHGSDIQPWHRRKFNATTSAERTAAVKASEQRSMFWRGLMKNPPSCMRFVFVSRTFATQVQEDIGVDLADDLWKVIHNPIDTGLFRYRKKPPGQRFKILLVRPHHSRVYANDIAARVIAILSSRPEFERMQFMLVGDGPLFEQNFGGLLGYSNVHIRRSFLSQQELAGLYGDYGVFLVPTRGDTQGVARDEAMACGLVPVTNSVGAVPEFVDDDCAMLAPAEDADAMAEAILSLVGDPGKFERKSSAAAARVRRQSGIDDVVAKEIEWCIGLPVESPAGVRNVRGGAGR